MARGVYLLGDLAQVAGAELRGDAGYQISAVAPLDTAGSGDLTFYHDMHLRGLLKTSKAGAILIAPQEAEQFSGNCLLTDNPYAAFARVMQHIYPQVALGPDCIIRRNWCAIASNATRWRRRGWRTLTLARPCRASHCGGGVLPTATR